MLPFAYSFSQGDAYGLGWFLPAEVFLRFPFLTPIRASVVDALGVLTFVIPVLLVIRVQRSPGPGLPLISLLLIVTNGGDQDAKSSRK